MAWQGGFAASLPLVLPKGVGGTGGKVRTMLVQVDDKRQHLEGNNNTTEREGGAMLFQVETHVTPWHHWCHLPHPYCVGREWEWVDGCGDEHASSATWRCEWVVAGDSGAVGRVHTRGGDLILDIKGRSGPLTTPSSRAWLGGDQGARFFCIKAWTGITTCFVSVSGHEYKAQLVRAPAMLMVSMGDEEAKVSGRQQFVTHGSRV